MMQYNTPLISVILPLYNAEKYIEESVRSILNQSFANFEFIIIDDGSTDNSAERIKRFSDSRIIFISQPNQGMAATLNNGIAMAKGEYLARQDADDISYPKRFEKQVKYLDQHPECALLGTWARIIPDVKFEERAHRHPSDNLLIKQFLLFDNPFVHSSVMIRKSYLQKTGFYDISKSSLIQDYDLWSRIARHYQVANIPEILVDYREVTSGISQTTVNAMKRVMEQSVENMQYYLGSPSPALEEISHLVKKKYYLLRRSVPFEKIKANFLSITHKLMEGNSGAIEDFVSKRDEYLKFFRIIKKRHRQFGPLYFDLYTIYSRTKKLVLAKIT
jgi:glycosyltransferase involved in cell wall biosynthesis